MRQGLLAAVALIVVILYIRLHMWAKATPLSSVHAQVKRDGAPVWEYSIIFIILVLLNVDVTYGYCGTKWRCSHGNGIFETHNYCCCHSVNKAQLCLRNI